MATKSTDNRKHYAAKIIRPAAIQAGLYLLVSVAALVLSLNGGNTYDLILSGVLLVATAAYIAYQTFRLTRTYYQLRPGSLTVSTPAEKRTVQWDDIQNALYDATSKSIELVLMDGTSIRMQEYDDLRVLTQGLDMRGVRLEYKRM